MFAKKTLLGALLFTVGCGGASGLSDGGEPGPAGPVNNPGESTSPAPLILVEAPVTSTEVDSAIESDPTVESLVTPFRVRMADEVRLEIGEVAGVLTKALPEGTLGNFAADAMLWAANREFQSPVQMALTNNGGLRVPIGPGPITVGQMYELMPFENMLSVLTLTGAQLQALCNELAQRRGAPISGFSFVIVSEDDRRVASEVLVGGEPLDPVGEYLLVTNDYMANGGDAYETLTTPTARTDLPVLIRDAFIDYVRFKGVIEPRLEGRITGGIG